MGQDDEPIPPGKSPAPAEARPRERPPDAAPDIPAAEPRSRAAPEPEGIPPSIADDSERRPEGRHVELVRTICWIVTASIASGQLVAAAIAALAFEQPIWSLILQAAFWLLGTAALIWWSRTWPALEHRFASYRVSPRRIEIRHGVLWRSVTSVPLSRVQHTDVTQGPVERVWDLASLVIHTAGTENATVTLSGLAPRTASDLRDFLLAGGGDDAV